MEMEVLNIGEPAFLSHVALVIPRVTPLVRIPPICHDSTDKHTSETQILVCDIGNPLERNVIAFLSSVLIQVNKFEFP
jgi:hypothetical protein